VDIYWKDLNVMLSAPVYSLGDRIVKITCL